MSSHDGSIIERYRDGTYLLQHPDWHIGDARWKARFISKILDRNKVKFSTLVEVGCGAGKILEELADINSECSYYGFDISPDASKFWPSENSVINLQCRNFMETSECYDVLLLIDVFEHVEDYMGFLRNLRARAHYFVFHIPLDMHVQGLLRDRQIVARNNIGHLHYFAKSTALATLKDVGFQIVDYSYTNETFLKERPALRTKLMNILRSVAFRVNPDATARILGGYSLMVLAT